MISVRYTELSGPPNIRFVWNHHLISVKIGVVFMKNFDLIEHICRSFPIPSVTGHLLKYLLITLKQIKLDICAKE